MSVPAHPCNAHGSLRFDAAVTLLSLIVTKVSLRLFAPVMTAVILPPTVSDATRILKRSGRPANAHR